jgi:hypothetical protein
MIRVEGGGHGFRKPGDGGPVAGFEAIFGKVVEWCGRTWALLKG